MICLYVFKLLDARKRKTIEEGKLEAIAPKGMGIKSKETTSSKEILATIPENYEIMLPIKFLEIDIAGNALRKFFQEKEKIFRVHIKK